MPHRVIVSIGQTGRHKRNATFPGSKATTIPSQQQPPPQQHQSTAPNSPCLSQSPFHTHYIIISIITILIIIIITILIIIIIIIIIID